MIRHEIIQFRAAQPFIIFSRVVFHKAESENIKTDNIFQCPLNIFQRKLK